MTKPDTASMCNKNFFFTRSSYGAGIGALISALQLSSIIDCCHW